MTRWSRDTDSTVVRGDSHVIRADSAGTVAPARFDVALGERIQLPEDVREDLRAQAMAAGFAHGWAEGRRAAEEAGRADREQQAAEADAVLVAQVTAVQQVVEAVAGAVAAFEQRAAPTFTDLENDLIATAFAIAEAVIGRELATATEPGRDALTRALALAPRGSAAVVRMNPADAALLPGASQIDGRDVVVIADPGLAPGDAVVESETTTIDARLGAALERVRAALSP
jgi:flagellar assembly protein FliH